MAAFAKKIRYSGPLKTRLEDECNLAKLDFHVPERNVSTRWNSTIAMMNSTSPLRAAIDNLCDREPGMRKYKLTEHKWDIVRQLQPVLVVSPYRFHPLSLAALTITTFLMHRAFWTRQNSYLSQTNALFLM